ncbi:MAG: hypothetical protein AAFN77_11975 [Planctomycetota bacterium]
MPTKSLIVQHIHITWTKASRGGRLAELRNRIAKSFAIPDTPPTYDKNAHYLVHFVGFGERNEFAEPLRSEITQPNIETEFITRNCSVEMTNDGAIVTYEWRDGAPERKFFDKSGTPVPVRKQMSVRLSQQCFDAGKYGEFYYLAHDSFRLRFNCEENLDNSYKGNLFCYWR